MTTNPNGNQPEFPNYFDPNREEKAAAREQAEAEARGETPAGYEGYEQYPTDGASGVRDGMVEIDELGNPIDPHDPDLADINAMSGGMGDAGGGPRLTGFPFPGIAGTTRGGMSYRVGGCCLPIPLMAMAGLAATALGISRARR